MKVRSRLRVRVRVKARRSQPAANLGWLLRGPSASPLGKTRRGAGAGAARDGGPVKEEGPDEGLPGASGLGGAAAGRSAGLLVGLFAGNIRGSSRFGVRLRALFGGGGSSWLGLGLGSVGRRRVSVREGQGQGQG